MHLFSKRNIYKDSIYVDLSHRGCPPLLVTCWVVNQRCREQIRRDLGSGLPSPESWWAHADQRGAWIMVKCFSRGRSVVLKPQGGTWVMVKCFSRGRSVVLKPQSVLVLSSSNNHMPEKVLWTLPNQAHSAQWRDEQPGSTTLLSTAIWLAFCSIFKASEEMSVSPLCSLWLLPAKKRGGITIHLGAEQPCLEQAECPG